MSLKKSLLIRWNTLLRRCCLVVVLGCVPLVAGAVQSLLTYQDPAHVSTNMRVRSIIRELNQLIDKTSAADLKRRTQLVNRGISLAPKNPEIIYHGALLEVDQEHYQKAENLMQTLPEHVRRSARMRKLQQVITKQLADQKKRVADAERMLASNPKDLAARLVLIREELLLMNYVQVQHLISDGLSLVPKSSELWYQQVLLDVDLDNYAAAKEVLSSHPEVLKMKGVDPDLPTKIAEGAKTVGNTASVNLAGNTDRNLWIREETAITNKNIVQAEIYPAFASDREHPWFYNNYTYGRFTDYGSYYVSVNQAMRNNITGYQYVASGYPKLNRHLYLFTEYANSSSSLYPQDKATLRANVVLSDGVEVAPGGQYFLIEKNELWSYTVWLSKEFGNNWIAVKPFFYKLKGQDPDLYMVLNYRYYFSTPRRFFDLAIGAGKTPDLLDLSAAGLIVVNQFDFFGTYHFAIKDHVFLYFGAGYVRQQYPTGLLRKIPTMLYGIATYF